MHKAPWPFSMNDVGAGIPPVQIKTAPNPV